MDKTISFGFVGGRRGAKTLGAGILDGFSDSATGAGMKRAGSRVVGYLSSEYPAISHTFIYREVQALRGRGTDVRTVSIHYPNHQMSAEETAESGTTHYIRRLPLWRLLQANARVLASHPVGGLKMLRYAAGLRRLGPVRLVRLMGYVVEAGALLDWAERSGVRHVHVHFANPAATVALIASASGRVEFSVSVHGPDVFYNIPGNFLAEKVRRAKFVRCISHYCRSQVMRVMSFDEWGKLHIVRCGIDTSVFSARPDPGNSTVEIICVGRLVPAKAQHLLISACKTLRDRGHDFHLTLIGDGPDRESLKLQVLHYCLADRVTFALGVTPDRVNGYLAHSDIMVLPSFAEGLPVVLMEAMAREIPCISTRIMGIPELIEHEKNGLLTAASDLDELVAQMERLLTDKELRGRLGRAARLKVVAEFGVERTGELMEGLFAEHIAETVS